MEESMATNQIAMQQQVEAQLTGMQTSIDKMQAVIERLSAHVMNSAGPAPEQAPGAFGPEQMPGGQGRTDPRFANGLGRERAEPPFMNTSRSHYVEYGLQTQMPKQLLSGIDKLENIDEWPRFSGQVRMMLDASYPFIGNWMRAIGSCDSPPTPEWVSKPGAAV